MQNETETKEPTTAVATTAVDPSLPSFLQNVERTDRSNLDVGDFTIPRIKVAQDQNQEVKDGIIPRGALFLNVTGEALAKFDPATKRGEPLRIIPIIVAKEYILWRDQNDNGGGMLARARPVIEEGKTRYKWDNPNETFATKIKGVVPTQWTTKEYVDEDGLGEWGTQIAGDKDSPPAASVHYNYLVLLPDFGNSVAAFSLSKSQVKRARDLNAMLEQSKLPIYARLIQCNVEPDKNNSGQEFFNVRFRPAGVVQSEDLYNYAKSQHEHYANAGFVVSQDKEDEPAGNKSGAGRF